MNIDSNQFALVQTGTMPASTASDPTSKVGDREKIAQLAHEFEAMMLMQMLRQMRESYLDEDGEGTGLGADTMRDTVDMDLARQLSATGGFGLAAELQRALERQLGDGNQQEGSSAAGITLAADPERARSASRRVQPGPGSSVAQAASVVEPTPSAADASQLALPLPLDAPLSSHFGWRQDPFGQGVRFHDGIDLAAAYGRQVPVVADGRVKFAGTERGYGNTVVVEHAGGVTTRYAHLECADVKPGDEVRAGEVIGRVGQSGRSTGPHLHFEVLQGGKPVSPELVAARFEDRLKDLRAVPINH